MTEVLEKEDTIQLRLVTNPFDTSNVIKEELVYNPAFSIEEYMQGLPSPDSWLIGVNGMAIRKDLWPLVKPNANAVISLVRVPEGGSGGGKQILRLVAMIALAVAAPYLGAAIVGVAAGTMSVAVGIATAAVMVAGSLLINALIPPPGLDLNDGTNRDVSPSYGIDGPKNTNVEGIVVPVGYGEYRIAGNFVDIYTENIGNTQYLFTRTILNDGRIESVSDIEINDQPIANFQSVQTRVTFGEETETVNDWFPQSVKMVNRGVKVENAYITHTTEAEVDKIRLDLVAPNGIVEYDNKGREQGRIVNFEVQYRAFGSSTWELLPVQELVRFTGTSPAATNYLAVTAAANGSPIAPGSITYQATTGAEYRAVGDTEWTAMGTQTRTYNATGAMAFGENGEISDPGIETVYEANVPPGLYEVRGIAGSLIREVYSRSATGSSSYQMSGRSTQAIRKTLESVQLPRGRYDVRIRRTTPVSTSGQVVDDVFLTDVGEIDMSPVRMNGTATLSTRIKVTDQINSQPKITALVRFSRLQEYDEDGNPTVERWSANPAWIVIDILTNPVRGAGMSLNRFDWPKWVEFARFCEENSLEFNGIFDFSTSVWEATQAVLRCGHAQFVRMGTKWSVSIDRASDPVMLFNDSNIIEGTLKTTWLPMIDRANEIQLSYAERTDGYKQRTIRLVDNTIANSGEKVRSSSYQQLGVTSHVQAAAEAEYQLRRNRLLKKSLEFEAPIEAIALNIGDVANIQYQAGDYAGGAGGRCAAGSTLTQLNLDRPVTVEAGQSYRVLVHHAAVKRYDVNIVSIAGRNVLVSGLPAGTINRCTRLRMGTADVEVIDVADGSPNDIVRVASTTGLTTGPAELWDTNVIEERTVSATPGEYEQLTVTSPFSVAPTQYSNWLFGRVASIKQPFRLIGIAGDDVHQKSLSFIQYDENLYLPPGVEIPVPEPTPIDTPQQVRDVSVVYNKYPTGDQNTVIVGIAWDIENRLRYGGADIYINENATGWRQIRTVVDVLNTDVEIRAGSTGFFKVVGYDKQGRRASFYEAPTYSFNGDLVFRALEAPTGLTVDSRRYDILSRLEVSWLPPADEVVTLYRVDYRRLTQAEYDAIQAGTAPLQPPANASPAEMAAWDALFRPAFVTSDTSGVIDNLPEGYYSFRVRAERGQSTSPWHVIQYTLDVPGFIDAVTGLQLDGGGTTFTGRDAAFRWDDIFINAASAEGDQTGIPFVLRHYEVQIRSTDGELVRTEYVTTPAYTYTYEKNVADSASIVDTARRTFQITVRAIGRQGQISAPASLTVINPPPALPGVEIVSLYSSVVFRFTEPLDPDFAGFVIYRDAVNGVPVGDETPPTFVSGTTVSVAENTTGTIYTASAAGAGGISYSLSGADAARFTLNSSTGALAFVTAPDFENPTDADANNVYTVTITATNAYGSANRTVNITVTDVAEGSAPVFTSGATASFAENGTGTVYTAVASGSSPITYSIVAGGDAARFSINSSTGVVTFNTPPDFENPTDANTDNVYNITVRATNSLGSSDRTVAITVTDVAEGTAPVFTSGTTASFAENGTGAAYTAVATGSGPITYSINGGADAARFSINSSTGVLTFNTPPDFENPTDVGGNNVYNVTVRATNSFGSADRSVAITVTDVAEGTAPVFTSGTTVSFAENGTGTVYTAAATGSGPISYSIVGGVDAARFSINSSTGALTFNTPPDFENPTDSGANNVYNVTIRATNSFGSADRSVAITVTDVAEGTAPAFTSGTTATFAENATGTVYTAAATGTAPITYSISGGADAARFSINSSTGALTFVSPPDFENPTDAGGNNVYDVTIQASNSFGSATRNVAVTVTDVAEGTTRTTPVFRSSAGAQSFTIPRPAGVVAGDLLVGVFQDFASNREITIPSGWTAITGTLHVGGDVNARVAYKIAGASEPTSYTFSIAGSPDYPAGVILAFSNVDTASPIGISGNISGSNSVAVLPSVAVPNDNSAIAAFVAGYNATPGSPPGLTFRQSGFATHGFSQGSVAAGASGDRSTGQTHGMWIGVTVSINGAVS